MDDLLKASPDSSEIQALRAEVDQLVSVVRLSLCGLLVITLSLGVFIYRGDKVLYRQLEAQKPYIVEAQKRNPEVLAIVTELQKFAATHPAYATNVLARFNLQPLASTGLSTGAPKK